ncbi:TPM domain-containing protein [Schnuerera sp. xch1]|uniref:TPM domain-containing protein n=1 Tax=Schnuerera sp. xch1 TaxID=2874283 RepID=UPI001CBBCCA1|nr:TPM domain-containing protein [Schnuerera sp. xch1]MBZ2175308.1 TPM domain-containing protein [Schnuerera sp. xch1]
MRRKTLFLCLMCILIILQTNFGLATDINLPRPSNSFYVYDEPDILEKQAEEYVIRTDEELYKKSGVQIVVASINSLEGMDIREYAVRLFEKWGIGSDEYDNGLLILIVPENREIWIEVGYGLEGILPDSKVGNIIENSMLPHFRENNYSDGIISGFNEILNEVEKGYNINLGRERINEDLYNINGSYSNAGIFDGTRSILMIVGVIVFLFIDFKFFNGLLTYFILFRGHRNGGGSRNRGGGGRSGGGGAGGRW